jgi:hypothetical protein
MAGRDDKGRFTAGPDELTRAEIAEAAGLRGSMGARLKGSNADELAADAKALAGTLAAHAGGQAAGTAGEPPATMDAVIRGAFNRTRSAPAGEDHGDWLGRAIAGGSTRQQAPTLIEPPSPAPGGFDQGARGAGAPKSSSVNEAIRDAFGRG